MFFPVHLFTCSPVHPFTRSPVHLFTFQYTLAFGLKDSTVSGVSFTGL